MATRFRRFSRRTRCASSRSSSAARISAASKIKSSQCFAAASCFAVTPRCSPKRGATSKSAPLDRSTRAAALFAAWHAFHSGVAPVDQSRGSTSSQDLRSSRYLTTRSWPQAAATWSAVSPLGFSRQSCFRSWSSAADADIAASTFSPPLDATGGAAPLAFFVIMARLPEAAASKRSWFAESFAIARAARTARIMRKMRTARRMRAFDANLPTTASSGYFSMTLLRSTVSTMTTRSMATCVQINHWFGTSRPHFEIL